MREIAGASYTATHDVSRSGRTNEVLGGNVDRRRIDEGADSWFGFDQRPSTPQAKLRGVILTLRS
jgi:hypothetical protein